MLSNNLISVTSEFNNKKYEKLYRKTLSVSGKQIKNINIEDLKYLETFIQDNWIIPSFNLNFCIEDLEKIKVTDWLPSFISQEELVLHTGAIKTFNGQVLNDKSVLTELRTNVFHYQLPYCLSYFNSDNCYQDRTKDTVLKAKINAIIKEAQCGYRSLDSSLNEISKLISSYKSGFEALNLWIMLHGTHLNNLED